VAVSRGRDTANLKIVETETSGLGKISKENRVFTNNIVFEKALKNVLK
jgi:hypothetical protein